MKTNLTILTLIFGMIISVKGSSQSHVLDAYQEEGIRNNLQLKQEQFHYEHSLENLNQARALFMPHVAFRHHTRWPAAVAKLKYPQAIC